MSNCASIKGMRGSFPLYFLIIFFILLLTWRGIGNGYVKSSNSSRDTITIFAVGDIMLGRSVNANIQARHDPFWPFTHVASLLKTADLTIGNLESPLIYNCPIKRDGMVFCGDAGNAIGLAQAGFDYLSLANNHTNNYGKEGFGQTQQILTEHGLGAYGTGEAVFSQVKGVKIALLGYDDITTRLNLASIAKQIANTDSRADFTIVYFHWGEEYVKKSNNRQQQLAHIAVQAGADLVLGAHPHVVQDSEYYQGIPIYYSLGNFVFDQEWSKETKKGLAVRLTYLGTSLQNVEQFPVFIKNYGQAFWQ